MAGNNLSFAYYSSVKPAMTKDEAGMTGQMDG